MKTTTSHELVKLKARLRPPLRVRLPDGRIRTARDSIRIEPALAAAMLASVR